MLFSDSDNFFKKDRLSLVARLYMRNEIQDYRDMDTMLTKGERVGKFRVDGFLKAAVGGQTESYFVIDEAGNTGLMKLWRRAVSGNEDEGTVERNVYPEVAGEGVFAPLADCGTLEVAGVAHDYLVRRYVEGVRLDEWGSLGRSCSWEEAVEIVSQLLEGLRKLHSLSPMVIHNDVTPRNVILEGSKVWLVGTGHLSNRCGGRATFSTKDLNNWYRAPETFVGIYDEQSDVFSVGALMYTLLTGIVPWGNAGESFDPQADKKNIRERRSGGKSIVDEMLIEEEKKDILWGMLALDYNKRFRNVDEVLNALRGNGCGIRRDKVCSGRNETKEAEVVEEKSFEACVQKHSGGGFADVAGMEEVKRMLYKDVMFVLNNKEKAEKYRLRIPNGALFYGPPGCGKTFIAEKFAQESRMNFMLVKASDLGSIYIHGTQGKIAELFEEAAKKAPTILCFDELDGMAPNRSKIDNESLSGEVNEFLSQLNNCSERGIFVIGTSNRPEKIDPAVLRAGRMDKMVYIPMPDREARRELFKLYLEGRFCDESIDCEELASQSEGFVASDICFMVNETALNAAMNDEPVSQHLLLEEIRKGRRSVSKDESVAYEQMRQKFENRLAQESRRRIGFAQIR